MHSLLKCGCCGGGTGVREMPVSVVQAFAHAQKVKHEQHGVGCDYFAGSTLSPQERAALLIGRKWWSYAQNRRALHRERLIEHLLLEKSVKTGIARMVFFLCVFFFNLLLTSVDVNPEYKLQLRSTFKKRAVSGTLFDAAFEHTDNFHWTYQHFYSIQN